MDAGKHDHIWDELAHKLPWHRNPEQLALRKKMWAGMDVNGNGYMSLAEVDKGMRDIV